MPDDAAAAGSVELRCVSKHYGVGRDRRVAAADEISLRVEAGSFVALTGASGSGKSTLLHLIGAIERPDCGTILSGGTEVTALRGAALAAYRRTLGFVFQRYNLLPALTALDNVIAPVLPYRTADEPTGNLDSRNAAEILALLARLRGERAMTVVLASHDPQIAARSERLIRLRDGAVTDDIDLTDGYCVDDVLRQVGQLG